MGDRPLLVGLDAGTGRIRALAFEPDGGAVVAEAGEPTPIVQPRPGWAHHEPEALWRAAASALRALAAKLGDSARRVAGIAVASVGETGVPLDGRDEPTHPAIAWFDARTRDQLDRLLATVGADRLHALTGLAPDPTFGLCKLLWLRENEPEAFGRTRRWLHVSDYLAWRLSGVGATDYSLASRTLALDLRGLRWADEFLAEQGVPAGLFAPLAPSGTRLGGVTAEAARATGLPEGCAVGVGGHDHICGALAVGALEPGVLLDSMGTAEALTLAIDRPSADPVLGRRGYSQGAVGVPGRRPVFYVFGGLLTSGACVEWFRRLVGGGDVPYAELIAEAEAVPPGSHGTYFLPAMGVRVSPDPDPAARGAFLGLAADAGRGMLFRAVLEGLAYEARAVVDVLREVPDLPEVRAVRAIGGNTRNALLLRIKAAAYGRPLAVVETAEASSLGAALLGGLAAGVFPDLPAALAALRPAEREVGPDPAWAAAYDARYRGVYRGAYARLRPLHEAAREVEARGGA